MTRGCPPKLLALLLSFTATLFACSALKSPGGPATATAGASASSAAPNAVATATERPEHAKAKVPVSVADPQWGNVDAPVTVVVFSDFQCPFCSRVVPTLSALQQKYGPEQLRIVFKHNPLPFHEQARPAAEAASAVYLAGGATAFFAFHDLAFANQQNLSTVSFEQWARSAGVEPAALRKWLQSGQPARKVEEDLALARAVGAFGTPAFRINGVTLSGAQPLPQFVALIDAQLLAARELRQAGTPAHLVYRTLTDRNFVEPAPPQPDEDEEDAAKIWAVPVAADDPVRGEQDALVTIVQFSEFQCPFCKRVEPTLAELRRIYGRDLRVVWKDNPLPFHPRAMPAALLARQAYQTKGNDAFWKLHDALFESQPRLDDADLEEVVNAQGLSWKALSPAFTSEKLKTRISASMDQASDFEARGTPHFFINGRRLAGAQPLEAFKKLVDEQLAKARALVESGTPRARVYAELTKDGALPPPPEQKQVPLPANAASRGSARAPVVIQIFSDFQCPFCKRVEPTVAQLEQEFKGQLRVVWRHLPLPFHQYAQLAAEASEEALAQKGPEAFWKFHDALFDAQGIDGGLARPSLDQIAAAQGLDMARFAKALDDHVHAAKVKADADAAATAEINGTPGFLINDYYLSGAQAAPAFRKLIVLALKDRKKP